MRWLAGRRVPQRSDTIAVRTFGRKGVGPVTVSRELPTREAHDLLDVVISRHPNGS